MTRLSTLVACDKSAKPQPFPYVVVAIRPWESPSFKGRRITFDRDLPVQLKARKFDGFMIVALDGRDILTAEDTAEPHEVILQIHNAINTANQGEGL